MLPASVYQLTAPTYKLKIDGLNSKAVADRLLSITVTLNSGNTSDQLQLSFDDRPQALSGNIALPKTGKKIEVLLGYELYKVSMGKFHVDQVSLSGSGSGQTLEVTAVPYLLLDEATKTWAKTTLGAIVKEIAGNNKLTAKISPKLSSIKIDAENQSKETDLAFLTRLAERYDAFLKPAADKLLFLNKGVSATASGLSLLPISLGPTDVINWSCQLSDRNGYGSVVATWHDRVSALQQQVEVKGKYKSAAGNGKGSIYRLRHLFNSEDEAKTAAKAKIKELNRDTSTMNLTIIGNPDITAEGKVLVHGLRDGVDGIWMVRSVTHSFSTSGYQTTLQCYKEP